MKNNWKQREKEREKIIDRIYRGSVELCILQKGRRVSLYREASRPKGNGPIDNFIFSKRHWLSRVKEIQNPVVVVPLLFNSIPNKKTVALYTMVDFFFFFFFLLRWSMKNPIDLPPVVFSSEPVPSIFFFKTKKTRFMR